MAQIAKVLSVRLRQTSIPKAIAGWSLTNASVLVDHLGERFCCAGSGTRRVPYRPPQHKRATGVVRMFLDDILAHPCPPGLAVYHADNPFRTPALRWRNFLLFLVLPHLGLRLGEAAILSADAIRMILILRPGKAVDVLIQNYRRGARHGFLFGSQKGNPLALRQIYNAFEIVTGRLSEAATRALLSRGKEAVMAHDLRHTCAV